MSLFNYPKALHRRSQYPPNYSHYRQYKPHLRIEFLRRCIYCQKVDARPGDWSFHVEHYRPKKKFPELETEYTNLYYACEACNVRKGPFWPSREEVEKGIFIPNPCDYRMFDHLKFNFAEVVGRSTAGQWTLELLDLNDSDTVAHREALIAAFAGLDRTRRELKERIDQVVAKAASDPSQAPDLESEKAILEADIDKIGSHIDLLFAM